MLAYVFWHRPRAGVEVADYEQAQREFHAAIQTPSACFRLGALPFGKGVSGYEDWYLVESWTDVGELNAQAVEKSGSRAHSYAASLAGDSWGGIYELVRGTANIPTGVEWLDKPRGEPSENFIASLPHDAVWRRQLVLGPAPEFCCSAAAANSGTRSHL